MNINKFLFQKSWIYFALFFGFALWGFWPSYYSDVSRDYSLQTHLHGIGMTLWCLMLISQAYLIKINKRTIHRYIGKASYVLVPFIVGSTVVLTHSSLYENTPYNSEVFSDLALMINATLLFLIIYGLAIYHKKDALTHARYMFCTIFPMFTPITDRIIYNYFRPLVDFAPTLDGAPVVPFFGFLLANVIVAGFTFWDWKSNKRKDVFPVVLVMLILYHTSVFTFHLIPTWRSFGEWFLG
ncbi:hypothetical protein [Gracilimonas sp.]|uniref:hypothetical protein n=1 Tax=Gracilimonas sp. TaxID=1974203 RepID=UPI0032EB0F33